MGLRLSPNLGLDWGTCRYSYCHSRKCVLGQKSRRTNNNETTRGGHKGRGFKERQSNQSPLPFPLIRIGPVYDRESMHLGRMGRGVSILWNLNYDRGPRTKLHHFPWSYHFILLILKELAVTLFCPHAYSTGAQPLISSSKEEVGCGALALTGRQ